MENTNQNPPSLTLNDLAVLRNVIEVAISRGTFKADEITVVGQTYDKLKAWLDSVAAQQAAEQPAAEEVPAEQPKPAKKAATKSTAVKQKGKK
jgi:translation initiation factor IF-2